MALVRLLAAVALLGLAGCTKTDDYTPPANITGVDVFNTTCVSCHASKGAYTFELGPDMNNPDAIAGRINQGTMGMPGFPNIQGQVLADLAAYVQSLNKAQ